MNSERMKLVIGVGFILDEIIVQNYL